ncbi:UNVERIFIED_CONTAM: hypothetical protein Sangu_2154700 [Sesamum angustifolium]|uniref:Uncharacterized protein n=1 Tax=Sesamum angustifolium TaxID=2727405 RepID=A0AAW2LE12_9LAMI
MAIWYPFTNSKLPLDESVCEAEIGLIRMDLQPSQDNYNEGDRLQTSESLSGFFQGHGVKQTIERIMHQDSNLCSYDGFRIGGIQ